MPLSPTIRPLDVDSWDDFARLVEANNGVWGGCWGMGFHPEGMGKDRTASQNREAKYEHFRKKTVRQVLVYDGDDCVGWCQYGRPAERGSILMAGDTLEYAEERDLALFQFDFSGQVGPGNKVARKILAASVNWHKEEKKTERQAKRPAARSTPEAPETPSLAWPASRVA